MTLSPLLALMEHAARKAGESLLHDFSNREKLTIEAKKPGDFVSEADRKSEDIITNILRDAHPDWGVLGEEGTAHAAGSEGCRWIIDPLDATTNFLRGIPHWCVTIALEKEGDIIAAVILDVIRNELFTAEIGEGAFLNGTPIQVSSGQEFDNAIVAMGLIPQESKEMDIFVKMFHKAYDICANVITSSSTVLDLAYVAAGRFDVYYSKGCSKPWDMAAGLLLINEAGGVVTNHNLKPASIYKNEVVAGNPVLYKAFIELIGLN